MQHYFLLYTYYIWLHNIINLIIIVDFQTWYLQMFSHDASGCMQFYFPFQWLCIKKSYFYAYLIAHHNWANLLKNCWDNPRNVTIKRWTKLLFYLLKKFLKKDFKTTLLQKKKIANFQNKMWQYYILFFE